MKEIIAFEERLDVALPRPRVPAREVSSTARAAALWADAVWREAEALGPIDPDGTQLARGLEIAMRPVFVCGAHRSGTTLVQNLLDGHPSLVVLPSEGSFLTRLQPRLLEQPPAQRMRFFGCEWLRRLANPANQAPYWLLGRSSAADSRYLTFARALAGWWPVSEDRIGATVPLWPMVAVVLAYRQVIGGFANCVRWVDKTPTNERFLEQLWLAFPAAKVIHVVRSPVAVYASDRALFSGRRARVRAAARVLRELGDSFRIAAERSRAVSDHYLMVRFEDLVGDSTATVNRIARFLDITALPALLRPTIAGLPALANSSFGADSPPGRILAATDLHADSLTRFERDRLTAILGAAAASIGYPAGVVGPWRRALLKATVGIL